LNVTDIERVGDNTDEKSIAAKRMAKFLDLIDATPGLGIPLGIIFLRSPRLRIEGVRKTKGYGWAPIS
jgi:hypothetical protein